MTMGTVRITGRMAEALIHTTDLDGEQRLSLNTLCGTTVALMDRGMVTYNRELTREHGYEIHTLTPRGVAARKRLIRDNWGSNPRAFKDRELEAGEPPVMRDIEEITDPAPGRGAFRPFLDQILDCHCDLCNERGYAASSPAVDGGTDGRPYRIANRILLDALIDGTHVRREYAEWIEICKARHAESVANGGPERGYYKASMRDFYASGMGLGMTPGGVGGSTC